MIKTIPKSRTRWMSDFEILQILKVGLNRRGTMLDRSTLLDGFICISSYKLVGQVI